MRDAKSPHCPRCDAPVQADAVDRLCPACLMSGALADAGRSPPPLAAADLPRDFGGYRLRGLLGAGGMGTVYEAEQLANGRLVALKMLDQQFETPEIRNRFLREGRLAASINHPNSLYIFGSEEIESIPVITMEIAAGGTLQDRLSKEGPLPTTEAVDAILDVVAGLEAASAAGVLHRDIKPSNCFVGPDGAVKVGDFGLSVSTQPRDDSYVTAPGVVLCTPAYAPPEQLRGDDLDRRADIYSVGATLFTLLTAQAPFKGENVVQVVANAIAELPQPVSALRAGVPPGLERVVSRCLAKEPDGRFFDYAALRNALLPFGSRGPVPASILRRVSAGWIDFLIAFLPAYLALMFLLGAEKLLVLPLVERTLHAARYHLVLLGCGVLYFAITEGIGGAGVGKWLKGLRVVRANGSRPGLFRALVRILVPLGCVEVVRVPLTMALISEPEWTGLQTALYVLTAIFGGCIPVLLALGARPANGFATVWDRVSGTRVVVKSKGTVRPSIESARVEETPVAGAASLGPYEVSGALAPGAWLRATDPALRRQVWLVRRTATGLTRARRDVARPGRLRWLQDVTAGGATWDAYEAPRGAPFSTLVGGGQRVPWVTLRHWLHELASELWAAARDRTLPAELSIDHVWITADGRALLLDEPWPQARVLAERMPVGDVAGQQRFLNAVATCVDSPGLPVHAARVLRNLEGGRFDKLGFVAGTLRGLLERPAEVGRGLRAGSLFLLPFYVWIAFVVGRYHDKPWDDPGGIVVSSALGVLGAFALIQLLALPFRTTASQFIFRLAVVNAEGEPATPSHLLARWAVVWLPLLLPLALLQWSSQRVEGPALFGSLVLLALWIGAAAYAVAHPRRGLHDRLTGTWVVRR